MRDPQALEGEISALLEGKNSAIAESGQIEPLELCVFSLDAIPFCDRQHFSNIFIVEL